MYKFIIILLTGSLFFQTAQAAEVNDTSAPEMTVLADIHFTPFADCTHQNCPIAIQLNKAPANQWPQILAEKSSQQLPTNGQETNYALFQSLLMQLQKQHPQNVMILGDFLAHRFRSLYLKYTGDHNNKHYEQFVLKTIQYITGAIQQAIPNDSAIFPVIGNNDSYGGEGCAYTDYCSISNGFFFRNLSAQWAGVLGNDENKSRFLSTFSKAGYYEVVLPNTHHHIIVLNTVLFSTKAQGMNISQAANEQLLWLQHTLENIAKSNERTWIIFHIPPGVDAYSTSKSFFGVMVSFWEKEYTQSFLDLIRQYNGIITGVLSGHVHMDGFLILDSQDPAHKIIDTFVSSISPIFGNNPSYKTYEYSNENFTLHDFVTYFLNLKHKMTEWQKEYDFANVYQPNDGLFSGYEKILADKNNTFSTDYIRFYDVDTMSQPISHGKWDYYWCATHQLNPNSYRECIK